MILLALYEVATLAFVVIRLLSVTVLAYALTFFAIWLPYLLVVAVTMRTYASRDALGEYAYEMAFPTSIAFVCIMLRIQFEANCWPYYGLFTDPAMGSLAGSIGKGAVKYGPLLVAVPWLHRALSRLNMRWRVGIGSGWAIWIMVFVGLAHATMPDILSREFHATMREEIRRTCHYSADLFPPEAPIIWMASVLCSGWIVLRNRVKVET